ncbi:MAG TPA: phospholipase D-like domain-containing protein, partial [Bryobacteraceae bacterium]|nr:phospholipase D-like domain-containing protein [Bryobacteraceae bacterium]
IADKQILKLLEDRAKAGVDLKIIGSLGARSSHLQVTPLTSMRLHTRTIIRDGRQAFMGSQSLRQPELDSRREIGMIVGDAKIVKTLLATFESDWAATGFDETREAVKADTEAEPQPSAKATKALAKEMPPLKSTLKKAIKQAVTKAGQDSLAHGNLKSTVKSIVKTAMKEAVAEMALESSDK